MIKAKSNGLDLYSHISSVLSTALYLNDKMNLCLNKEIVKWMCILHDLGKANPLFQSNMENNDFKKICRHEISSLLFIDAVPKSYQEIVGYIILSHHKSLSGDTRSFYDMMEEQDNICFKNHIGDIEVWGKEVKELLYYNFNKKIKLPTIERCKEIMEHFYDGYKKIDKGWSQYRALLCMADHFSSCFDNDVERVNILQKLFKKLNTTYYTGRNNLYPLSLIDSDETKQHTILIAPTGCGKTNFCMKRCHRRVYYVLPYQASINAMFKRINNDINQNEDYYFTIKHSSINSLTLVDEKTKKLSDFFGQSFKAITPFQIMGAIFGTKGYEMTMLDIMGQDVILDEIHTYDGKNLTAVLELIRVLKHLKCHIHICTATIPTCLKNEIINLLGEENIQFVNLSKQELKSFNRHKIHTVQFNCNDIIRRYNDGEKVLVVCNTKKSAKKMYETIKTILPNGKTMLIHSEYKRCDREKLENKLYKFNAEQEPCIVISTQVVEVSLDIDFDVQFTFIADIMSLIQRFGRVNRNRKGDIKDIFIYPPDASINEKAFLPYSKEHCIKTYEVLSKYNDKILEECEIQDIIDYVHSNIKKENFSVSQLDENNNWRLKMYNDNNKSIITSLLEIVGYVAVLKSDEENYTQTRNQEYEIPIRYPDKKMLGNGHLEIRYRKNNSFDIDYYVLDDNYYSEEIGIIH